uniref:Zinc finger protein 106 homolog n=1 Tax=Nothobranchius rachovii TaxID=451742 RepID=A0A1A8R3X8_9TELE
MAEVKPLKVKEHKAPDKNSPKGSKNKKSVYCPLCRKWHLKHKGHDHMHSLQHHRELESVLGRDACHDCQACKIKLSGLNEYINHISTSQHTAKLNSLKTKNVKPVSLFKTLGPEIMKSVMERNKMLRKSTKKAEKKEKKKAKQKAGKKKQGVAQEMTFAFKNRTEDRMRSMPARYQNWQPQTSGQGGNCVVVRNKENKMFQAQRPVKDGEPPFHNPNWMPVHPPGMPSGWPFNSQFVQYSFSPPANPPSYPSHLGDHPQSRFHHSQASRHFEGPNHHQVGSSDVQIPNAGNFSNAYDCSYNVSAGGLIPEKGVGQIQSEKTDSSQPSSSSAPLASANKAAPVRDIDVSSVLKQIRRELGVREPCRADREARKQSRMVYGNAVHQLELEQPAGTTPAPAVLSPQARTSAVIGPKQTEETSGFHQTSSAAADGDVSGREEEFRVRNSTASEPNLSTSRKIRIAHKSAEGKKLTPSKPVLDKLLSFSGAKSRRNWEAMFSSTKKKHLKDKQRFGTRLVNPPTDNGSAQDADLPLSQGFHWETLSDNPSVLPSNDGLTETQTVSQKQDTKKLPDASQAARVAIKKELNTEDEPITGKRERDSVAADGVSSNKKKKTKSNKDPSQMDQLLAVSLREDELSCSLQDLDKSLIQARTALQAAYAEVQKLLLLKEQMTSEVNSLRTKRIEILQGMQVGYSKASSPAGTTSPSGGASIVPPASVFSSSDFSNSTSQQPPAATPTSFITQSLPAPVAHPLVSVKQEVNPVLVQADAPFFPSNLLQQSHSAPSSSAARLAAESSASSTESSATRVKIQTEPQRSESESVEEVRGNPKKGNNKPAPEQQRTTSERSDGGNESDSSVEMIDSSILEVIDVDESDGESSVQPEEPSASVELTSVSTQTSQKSETDSKFQPPKDADIPPESAEADEPSLGAFSSHEGPVHGLQVHNGLLYTCSGDNTARAYSLMTRECEAVFHGHTNKVNCLLVSSPPNMPARLYTGSSDQTIRCYSLKSKKCLEKLSLPDRVFCLHIAWNILYVGLANGSVISLDLKTLKELDVFECHGPRGVSCLGTAQEGARRLLLVGSYDSTISVRDARSSLLLRSLEGHTKTVLCMKVVNDLVFSGSSDTSVHAHNIHTGELVRIYKGHGHAVTSIVILGKVMVTACLDKLVRVYELQSHDRLQVYGGHSDMVMCMAVHKSVIYTGCYDGTVQAVKLNLMRNHRCWWQSCSLIFGVPEHLLHHLVTDHSNLNLQTVKCRWKDCNAFFATQQAVKQDVPDHLQNHIDKDSKQHP